MELVAEPPPTISPKIVEEIDDDDDEENLSISSDSDIGEALGWLDGKTTSAQKLSSHVCASPLEGWEGRVEVGMSNSVTTAIRGSLRETEIGRSRNTDKADRGHLYIIDVSQSVDLDHPLALNFLREDCDHVSVHRKVLERGDISVEDEIADSVFMKKSLDAVKNPEADVEKITSGQDSGEMLY
ncbi:hypothetical protein HID58_082906 [Brassica napus]|uniref:non-specific serine/threonine protein kinase n=1 Tax=Brassica napus TaxID=3708 RepID=A0ABQ7YEZ0_BRANA|nr:hypothetical protein HID58_082906 [Brassica napus]